MKNKMYVRLSAILATLGVLLAGAAVTTTSIASASVRSSSPTNGPIHYNADPFGQYKTVNIDGTSVTNPSFTTGLPFYSHDFTKVAWIEMTLGMPSNAKVFVSDADGSNKKKILDVDSKIFLKAQFSNDNSQLFIMAPGQGLYSYDATTENQPLGTPVITPTTLADFSVSSTNKLAVAVLSAAGCSNRIGIVLYDLDGTNAETIEETCPSSGGVNTFSNIVQWDRDGSRLFVGQELMNGASETYRISVVQLDGTTSLLSSVTDKLMAIALSPDGTKIAYGTETRGTGTETMEIFVANTDGSGFPTSVITSSESLLNLSWSGQPGSGGSDSTDSGSTPSNDTTTETVVPGVTVTDTNIYTTAPKKVASKSAITVLTSRQTKTQKLVSNTPDVCLPNKDGIVFIDKGRCSVSILSKKSNQVLRRFRTTVVEDKVSELKVGNEVAILAPIYFDGGSTDVNDKGMKRIRRLKSKITAAGTVLVAGHSGIALGDTEENQILSRQRATSTVAAMKKVGARGPFFAIGVGGKDPLVTSTSGKDQSKNRRVVIILVP